MRAFALTAPDHPASLVDLPDPGLPPGSIRIWVSAASVNGFDVYEAEGGLIGSMPHDLPTVVGRDFAGVVDRVSGEGPFAVGDEVLGFIPSTPPLHEGSYAEIVTSPALVLAPKPDALSFEVAAAIPLAGSTALDAVNAVEPQFGQNVLVVGATGGVGSFAVQLASATGANVIATATPGEDDAYVRGLGASETIDYTAQDIAQAVRANHPDGVDAVIDMVNRGDAFAPIAALVSDGGRVASTVGGADVDALAARNVTAVNLMGTPTPEKLDELAKRVASGELEVEIQQEFPLAEAQAALEMFKDGKRGKIVVTIG
jgi:NADPH:quinone reductase-like Zn-dependent oxidoreductase